MVIGVILTLSLIIPIVHALQVTNTVPSHGSPAGGDTITINGSGFTPSPQQLWFSGGASYSWAVCETSDWRELGDFSIGSMSSSSATLQPGTANYSIGGSTVQDAGVISDDGCNNETPADLHAMVLTFYNGSTAVATANLTDPAATANNSAGQIKQSVAIPQLNGATSVALTYNPGEYCDWYTGTPCNTPPDTISFNFAQPVYTTASPSVDFAMSYINGPIDKCTSWSGGPGNQNVVALFWGGQAITGTSGDGSCDTLNLPDLGSYLIIHNVLTRVTVGGQPCTNVNVISDTQLTCTTPAHAPGTVDIQVITGAGTTTFANSFTYANPPTITVVDPTSGPPDGGNTLTVTGSGFTPAQWAPLFSGAGGLAGCAAISDSLPDSYGSLTPAAALESPPAGQLLNNHTSTTQGALLMTNGCDNVDFDVPGGQDQGGHGETFTFTNVSLIFYQEDSAAYTTPAFDPTVLPDDITGVIDQTFNIPPLSNITSVGITFTFSGDDYLNTCSSSPCNGIQKFNLAYPLTTTTATSVALRIGYANGQYTAGREGLTPAVGFGWGGWDVGGSGLYFADDVVPVVLVGGQPCTNVTVLSDTQLTCTAPAHAEGTVDVSVITGAGQATLPASYTYESPYLTVSAQSNVDLGTIAPGQTANADSSIQVQTNMPTGYSLYISATSGGNTNLQHTATGATIPTLGSSCTNAAPCSLSGSSWGWRVTNMSAGYASLPNAVGATGLVAQTVSANPTIPNAHTVSFGVSTSGSQTSGTYKQTVLYTAIAN